MHGLVSKKDSSVALYFEGAVPGGGTEMKGSRVDSAGRVGEEERK